MTDPFSAACAFIGHYDNLTNVSLSSFAVEPTFHVFRKTLWLIRVSTGFIVLLGRCQLRQSKCCWSIGLRERSRCKFPPNRSFASNSLTLCLFLSHFLPLLFLFRCSYRTPSFESAKRRFSTRTSGILFEFDLRRLTIKGLYGSTTHFIYHSDAQSGARCGLRLSIGRKEERSILSKEVREHFPFLLSIQLD